ncbi:hypothetical protein ISN45_Aa05g019270 [Arabidopsis thaliana x Arabidopsis arenosa]|uniref:Uncharacterized protein n=1 Tax=Arabidopsis thaliana x Arabidopsis arenosa TaxID=1240361 RepID=A0A8T1ZPP8_9BRAS|nr:hypothetical protein ISN45_Aa05g019270 [Arabidopsis thaliana x Arabidopsis arenosa]
MQKKIKIKVNRSTIFFSFHKANLAYYLNKHHQEKDSRTQLTYKKGTPLFSTPYRTMFRAMSTRKIHGGYEKLGDEEARLKRVSSVPASVYGQSRNPVPELKKTPTVKPTGGGPVHPLLSFFDVHFQRKKKKKTTKKKSLATAKPEFARYLEYVKEGGVWDPSSNAPAIHYR